LLDQSLQPSCIAFIDDKSTDDSVEKFRNLLAARNFTKKQEVQHHFEEMDTSVAGGFYASDKFKTVICMIEKDKNHGPSLTRNLAISMTSNMTDVYGLCDSDDVYGHHKVEKSLNLIVNHGFVIVYSDYITLDERSGSRVHEHKEPFSVGRLMNECIVSNNSFISKRVFETVGMYDIEMRVAEDYDLWIGASKKFKIAHIAEPLYTYRITGLGATFTVDKERWQKDWNRIKQKQQGLINADKQ
jgi:glycosyltransferase involved in cell wall biosynthesis